MLRQLNDLIKKADMFGWEVNLNFDQKGEYHNTILGGLFSILLNILILIYGGMRLNVMFNNLADTNISMLQSIDPNHDLGQIDINSTGMLFFIQLQQDHFNLSSLSIQNMSSFIDIYYEQSHRDFLNSSNFQKQIFNVRFCTQDDFGKDQESVQIFQSFNGSYILCPYIKNEEGLFQQTKNNGNILDSFKLEIVTCNQNSGKCAPKELQMKFMNNLAIVPYILQKKIDFSQYSGEPVYKQLEYLNPFYPAANPVNSSYNFITFIRKNLIVTFDAIIQLGQYSYQGQFFDLGKHKEFYKPEQNTEIIFRWQIQLDSQQFQHTRQTYSLLQLFGDVGGVLSLLTLIVSIFIYPFAEYSYKIKFLQRLYFVNTNDPNLMKPQSQAKKQNTHQQFDNYQISPSSQTSIQNHRIIHLYLKDYILLYISQCLGKLFCDYCWKKNQKLKKILEIGNQKFDSELNIVKIVKDLRNLKIIMKEFLQISKINFEIDHAEENIIDIEEIEQTGLNGSKIRRIESSQNQVLELIHRESFKYQNVISKISLNFKNQSSLEDQLKMRFRSKIMPQNYHKKTTSINTINLSTIDRIIEDDLKIDEDQNQINSSIKYSKSKQQHKNKNQNQDI